MKKVKVELGKNLNKIVTIPVEFASDKAEEFKHYHQKNIYEVDALEEIDDVGIATVNQTRMLYVQYTDIFRPNVLFQFSRKIDPDRFIDDEKYTVNCQFFFWIDESGKSHIRFASPQVDIDTLKER